MSTSRIQNGLMYALKCAAAGVVGTYLVDRVAGTGIDGMGEVAFLSATGGLLTGLLENPKEKEYCSARSLIHTGLHRYHLRYNSEGAIADIVNSASVDVIENMIAVTVGFLAISGLSYAARRHSNLTTSMTLGNLFRDNALGTIPVSVTFTVIMTIVDAVNSVHRAIEKFLGGTPGPSDIGMRPPRKKYK